MGNFSWKSRLRFLCFGLQSSYLGMKGKRSYWGKVPCRQGSKECQTDFIPPLSCLFLLLSSCSLILPGILKKNETLSWETQEDKVKQKVLSVRDNLLFQSRTSDFEEKQGDLGPDRKEISPVSKRTNSRKPQTLPCHLSVNLQPTGLTTKGFCNPQVKRMQINHWDLKRKYG